MRVREEKGEERSGRGRGRVVCICSGAEESFHKLSAAGRVKMTST